jgi:chromosome segregation ATPase
MHLLASEMVIMTAKGIQCRFLFIPVPEGRSKEEYAEFKREREQELRTMMKRLEAKYAALQVVPVISKLGTQRVSSKFIAVNKHFALGGSRLFGKKY